MASRKRTRFVKLSSWPVDWTCLGAPFVRTVTLHAVEEDGREVVAYLTPEEARALAARLIRRADVLDQMNEQHGNGYA